jgi:hypothetical protein
MPVISAPIKELITLPPSISPFAIAGDFHATAIRDTVLVQCQLEKSG